MTHRISSGLLLLHADFNDLPLTNNVGSFSFGYPCRFVIALRNPRSNDVVLYTTSLAFGHLLVQTFHCIAWNGPCATHNAEWDAYDSTPHTLDKPNATLFLCALVGVGDDSGDAVIQPKAELLSETLASVK